MRIKDEEWERQRAMFTKDCDAYRVGAAVVYDKPVDSVSPEERHRFKRAFMGAFRVQGMRVVQANHDYMERVVGELERRGIFDDVDEAVTTAMRQEEESWCRSTPSRVR
jgi:hypothetical protein